MERLVWGQQNGAGYLLGIAADIPELRPTTEQLEAPERRFRLLAERSGDVILQLDGKGTIRWVSPSLTPCPGWPPEDWIEQAGSEFLLRLVETPGT